MLVAIYFGNVIDASRRFHFHVTISAAAQTVCRDLDYIEDLDAILKAKLIEQLKYCDAYGRRTDMAADTPYTTIVHRDLWTNNIMLLKGTFSMRSFK